MKLSFVYLVAALASSHAAQATPVKNPKCASHVHLQSVENGAGVFFDDDCKIGYVLPPQIGKLSLSGIAASESLEMCEGVLSTMQATDALARKIKSLADQLAGSPVGEAPAQGLGSGGTLFDPAPSQPATQDSRNDDSAIAELGKIADLQTRISQLLAPYTKIEGATAQILMQTDQQKLVADYAAKNPKLQFFPLPLSGAYLSLASVKTINAGDFPAALSVDVPGLGALPIDNANPATPNVFRLAGASDPNSAKIFGESLSGQVRLSLLGACPFYDSSRHALKTSVSAQEIGTYLSANVQYSYELQARRAYSATYNLANLVTKIESKSTSGGFFSTSTAASIIDDTNDKSWFVLNESSDDSRVEYEDLSRTIKADLMDRVLQEITLSTVGGPNGLVDPAQPGPDGAASAADGLRKNCAHPYCQAGAAVLDFLNATFGSTSSVSSFIANNNYWASDSVTDRRMVPFWGSFSFTGRNE